MNKRKIYLAGGWFTPEMEEEHTRIYNLLKDDFDVFNPKLAGIVSKASSHDEMTKILIGNIEAIRNCDVVVMIYDGKDTGTIWESGFAYASKKPILYYAEKLNGKKFNVMLSKTGKFADCEATLLSKLLDYSTYEFKDVYKDYEGDVE